MMLPVPSSAASVLVLIFCLRGLRGLQATKSYNTLVDFKSAKVKAAVETLVQSGQACTRKTNATPQDVASYFTNMPSSSMSGRCFAACMLEQSGVINHGKVNRQVLLHLAGIVNGEGSRVVRKLTSVSKLCLDSADGIGGRCHFAAAYNDCLNEHMREFAFPEDIAEQAVRRMPFNIHGGH